jgi:hypothetical protein
MLYCIAITQQRALLVRPYTSVQKKDPFLNCMKRGDHYTAMCERLLLD